MFICLLYVLENEGKTLNLEHYQQCFSHRNLLGLQSFLKYVNQLKLLQKVKRPTSIAKNFLTLPDKYLKKNWKRVANGYI